MKLEINNRQKIGILRNTWKLNNTFLNNQWVKEEITREIREYFVTNENEGQTYQNLPVAEKTVLRRKLI